MMPGNPTAISIITAVFNGARTIEGCIQSIVGQSLPPEHIVVDGGSTDGTLEIARRHVRGAAKVVSGPDRGIYDAMNRGIALASGEVVGILNADDFYPASDILEKVAAFFADPTVDACYGDLNYVRETNTEKVVRRWRSGAYDAKRFYQGWMPPHPTFFVRRRCYEKFGRFRLDVGSAADYELMLRFLLKHRIKAVYLPVVMVHMRTGGASNASLINRLRANRMDRRAWQVNRLTPWPWTMLFKPLRKIGQYF